MAPERSPWLAIVNPESGRSRAGSGWPRIERALRARGIACEPVFTTRAHEGEELARRAVLAGRRKLIAVGGDGSAHDVVNGIMSAADAETARRVTLAVAPTGTGNDWARSLGVHRDAGSAADALAAGKTMAHDVGRIEFPDRPAATRGRWFINVAGAGYDAHVLSHLPGNVPSTIAYLRGALAGLASYRAPHFRIRAGHEVIDGRLLLAFVANGQYCGNRMRIAPSASTDDGLLDLVAVREIGLLAVLSKLGKLYAGNVLRDPAVHHVRAADVRVDAEPAVPVEADGQVVGTTPAVFSVRPRALRVVVA